MARVRVYIDGFNLYYGRLKPQRNRTHRGPRHSGPRSPTSDCHGRLPMLFDRTIRLTWQPELPEPDEQFPPGTLPLLVALEGLPPRLRVEAAYIAVNPLWQAMRGRYEAIEKPFFNERLRQRLEFSEPTFDTFSRDTLLNWWGPETVMGIVKSFIQANQTGSLALPQLGSNAGPFQARSYRALTEALIATDRVTDLSLYGEDLGETLYAVLCLGRAAWEPDAFGLGTNTLPPIFYDWLDAAGYDVHSPAYWEAEAVATALTTGLEIGFWRYDKPLRRNEETEFVLNDWWRRVQDELTARYQNIRTINGRR